MERTVKKIGLFFGSFNPVHNGHLILADYLANYTDLQEVWFVVSPHNPHKNKSSLLNQYQRKFLLEAAIQDQPKLKISTIEFDLPQPSYTIHTLHHLIERNPELKFALIIGMDNLESFPRWKNYESILNLCELYVYPRPGFSVPEWAQDQPNIHITETPVIELSSSFIRDAIHQKKSYRFMVPAPVFDILEKEGLYR